MPYIARHEEPELTYLETSLQNYRLHQEALQKHIMHSTPERTSLAKRISKDFLVPFSRHRITNEPPRKNRPARPRAKSEGGADERRLGEVSTSGAGVAELAVVVHDGGVAADG